MVKGLIEHHNQVRKKLYQANQGSAWKSTLATWLLDNFSARAYIIVEQKTSF